MNPILKGGVRILRPREYEALREAIPKMHHQIILDTALFTGMRWVELQRFKNHPEWYDPNTGTIYLPPEASRKKKRTLKERYVYLSSRGKAIIPLFLKMKEDLPSRIAWNENLKRWGAKAGIGSIGLCAKTTRKTWESWLITSFPERSILIAMSQGHTEITAMKHYLNLPFTEEDIRKIKEYTSGFGGV